MSWVIAHAISAVKSETPHYVDDVSVGRQVRSAHAQARTTDLSVTCR